MTDKHPYETRSRLRKPVSTEVMPGPVVAEKGQMVPSSEERSEGGGINNQKTGEMEKEKQEEIRRRKERIREILVDLDRNMRNAEVEENEVSTVPEEIEKELGVDDENRNQLAEEERVRLLLELEKERQERLVLEQLRLQHDRAEEENRERLRIEREQLEQLRRENQLMKQRLEQEKLQVGQRPQHNVSAEMPFAQDIRINSNYFPPQEINPFMNMYCEVVPVEKRTATATEKALKKCEENRGSSKKTWKKTMKTPISLRRKLRYKMLNKLLVPKSAEAFLRELKPGCTYTLHEQNVNFGFANEFIATVEHGGKVMAIGRGMTKMLAKEDAADNGVKVVIIDMLKKNSNKNFEVGGGGGGGGGGGPSGLNSSEIPLPDLASYALYKMLNEWRAEENDFPFDEFMFQNKPTNQKQTSVRKELPPDAHNLHPGYVLNFMFPGLSPVEVQRTQNNNMTLVTMGYEIDGKMYAGTSTNKKKAKMTAAKTVLSALYGVKYDN